MWLRASRSGDRDSPRRNLVAHLAQPPSSPREGKCILIGRRIAAASEGSHDARARELRLESRQENEAIERRGVIDRCVFRATPGRNKHSRNKYWLPCSISIRIASVHPERLIQVNALLCTYRIMHTRAHTHHIHSRGVDAIATDCW